MREGFKKAKALVEDILTAPVQAIRGVYYTARMAGLDPLTAAAAAMVMPGTCQVPALIALMETPTLTRKFMVTAALVVAGGNGACAIKWNGLDRPGWRRLAAL